MGRRSKYIVWQSASEIREWWDIHAATETPASLAMGLAGATGNETIPKEALEFKPPHP